MQIGFSGYGQEMIMGMMLIQRGIMKFLNGVLDQAGLRRKMSSLFV